MTPINARGSLRLAVDLATGDVLQQVAYTPFGRELSRTGPEPWLTPFGYAGGLTDPETGLVRFGARDYDAWTGRWTAKDPIGFAGGDVNLYGYVLGDPVNRIDSDGLNSLRIALAGPSGAALLHALTPPLVISAGAALGETAAELVQPLCRSRDTDTPIDVAPPTSGRDNDYELCDLTTSQERNLAIVCYYACPKDVLPMVGAWRLDIPRQSLREIDSGPLDPTDKNGCPEVFPRGLLRKDRHGPRLSPPSWPTSG